MRLVYFTKFFASTQRKKNQNLKGEPKKKSAFLYDVQTASRKKMNTQPPLQQVANSTGNVQAKTISIFDIANKVR